MGSGATKPSKDVLIEEASKPVDASDIDAASALDEVRRLRGLLQQHVNMLKEEEEDGKTEDVVEMKPKPMYRRGSVKENASLDENKDGEIDVFELRRFISEQKFGYSEEQVDAMFKVWDKDNSGTIDPKEFHEIFEAALLTHSSMSVSMVIPSTSNVDVQGTSEALEKRRGQVMEFLATRFGGATAKASHLGAYKAFDGSMVYEQGILVECFTTPQVWKEKSAEVYEKISSWCQDWGQECIALTVNGAMNFIVPPEEMNPDALCKQFLRRLQMRHRMKLMIVEGETK